MREVDRDYTVGLTPYCCTPGVDSAKRAHLAKVIYGLGTVNQSLSYKPKSLGISA